MSRKSAIYGVAAALALAAAPAFAQDAGSTPQTRFTPPPAQPRYATMIAPAADDALVDGPVAAPTVPVSTAPEQPVAAAPPPNNAVPSQPRYATMAPPPQTETVVVTGLRPSEDSLYRLGTGDTVRVTVFGETDLSGTFEIDSQDSDSHWKASDGKSS